MVASQNVFTKQNIGIVAAVLVLVAAFFVPGTEVLPREGVLMLGVFGMAAALWICESLPVGITGLLALTLVVVLGIAPLGEAFSGFAAPTMFYLMAAFSLSAVLKQTSYGMRLVLSTTRPLADVAEVNRMTKRYDWVVLDYNRHKDPAFLGAIEDPAKTEIMVNEFCAFRCPHRQEHYLHNSEDQRSGTMRPFECVAKRADFFDHAPGHPVIFTDQEVRDIHDAYGIGCFKIVGRGVAFQTVLEAYVYYLVRPEYRADVKRLVMRAAG